MWMWMWMWSSFHVFSAVTLSEAMYGRGFEGIPGWGRDIGRWCFEISIWCRNSQRYSIAPSRCPARPQARYPGLGMDIRTASSFLHSSFAFYTFPRHFHSKLWDDHAISVRCGTHVNFVVAMFTFNGGGMIVCILGKAAKWSVISSDAGNGGVKQILSLFHDLAQYFPNSRCFGRRFSCCW
ncbi:hypothetical protein BKA65DRAFT_168405 [Rhexocercosporidium sp. MPI-PUGE-AT-0058]|nr:hypothetical protein BKA65DRAFT_168405 [Rhexocercosporidium sp. MPI-PUGE-AT-0058]